MSGMDSSMFKLYFFDPETLMQTGYEYQGSFESEQECNQAAFESGKNYFRIELQTLFGSMLIYETLF